MSEEQEPYDAGDQAHVKRRRTAKKRADDDKAAFIIAAMGRPEGRWYFYGLMSDCGIFRTSFAGDPYRTAYQEGIRNVGLAVLADINRHCPEQYLVMLTEAAQREKAGA